MGTEKRNSSKMESVDSCETDILVNELRSAISDVADAYPLFSEHFCLYLWLKVSKMKVKEAEKAIRNSWKWRKDNDLLNVQLTHTNLDTEVFEFLPGDVTGKDKNGAPVLEMSIGTWRASACVSKFGRKDFVRFMCEGFVRIEKVVVAYHQYIRQSRGLTEKEKRALKTNGITAVLNFAQFSLRNCASLAAIQAGLECTRIFTTYFCGHIEKMIFINVNIVVTSLLKPFLPLLSTISVEIYGTDSKTWKPKLDAFVDPSQLLPSYGGTKCAKNTNDSFDFANQFIYIQ